VLATGVRAGCCSHLAPHWGHHPRMRPGGRAPRPASCHATTSRITW